MKDNKIALVAACDRNNFGDILMPILFEEYYKEKGKGNVTFKYFASSRADLRSIGGKVTEPLYNIGEDYKFVLFVGGEILTASYYGMFMNLQNNKAFAKLLHRAAHLFPKMTNSICKLLLHGETSLPWIIYPKNTEQRLYYNSVGGQDFSFLSESQIEDIKNLIPVCEYISVRDAATYNNIKNIDIENKVMLAPDTAIIMSNIFTEKKLNLLISKQSIRIINQLKTYYVVQVSRDFGIDIVSDITTAINYIYRNLGIKCLLMPIGRAEGHDDVVPLRLIQQKCLEGASVLLENNNIYDIMYFISHSIAFIGTSLHGVITAASYRIPHSVINPRCTKTINFISTWKTSSKETLGCCEDIISFIQNPNLKKTVLWENIVNMQYQITHHFDDIVNSIDNEE